MITNLGARENFRRHVCTADRQTLSDRRTDRLPKRNSLAYKHGKSGQIDRYRQTDTDSLI